jgi:hypothetical protein
MIINIEYNFFRIQNNNHKLVFHEVIHDTPIKGKYKILFHWSYFIHKGSIHLFKKNKMTWLSKCHVWTRCKNKHPIYDDETINIVNDMYKHFHNDVGKLLFMYF